MREIKFRAWDKITEEWNYFNLKNAMDISNFYDNFEDYINIEQFTGLHDKNGKEIYEGDIVKFLGHEVRNGKQIRPERTATIESKTFIQDCYKLYCLLDCNNTVEVIGNIHENSELIK